MKSSEFSSTDVYNLDLFFELTPDLMCIAGFDGYFRRINSSVPKALEYSKEELLSRPIHDFMHPEDRDFTLLSREEVKKKKPQTNFENRYITKSGDTIWLAWTAFSDVENELIFAIAKNITHKKKHEEERNALIARLTSINKELKTLTYSTSHDLRTPINNLLAVFSLMDVSKINDQETLELIDILKQSGETLKNTLNDYVDTLTQKEELNTKSETVSLEETLLYVRQSLHQLLKEVGAQIKYDFSAFNFIEFNKSYLESIFLNLISNSVKYAQLEKAPEISIYSTMENGVKQLVFEDNGLGFDMDKVKHKIFGLNQKFHTHADSKGIGLYLVNNHIQAMGAKIEVESEPMKGAKFIITCKDEPQY